jgi:hypothetical protein
MFRRFSVIFSAGAIGGLVNSIAVWAFGQAGITKALGVAIAPAITPQWLYPRIVWGGIWGFIFLLPILENSPFLQGIFFSLGPTLVQLFLVFPMKAHKGTAGLALGSLTPLFVVIFNVIWGVVAAYWIRVSK